MRGPYFSAALPLWNDFRVWGKQTDHTDGSKIARICEPSSIRISESLFLVLMAAATAKGLLA